MEQVAKLLENYRLIEKKSWKELLNLADYGYEMAVSKTESKRTKPESFRTRLIVADQINPRTDNQIAAVHKITLAGVSREVDKPIKPYKTSSVHRAKSRWPDRFCSTRGKKKEKEAKRKRRKRKKERKDWNTVRRSRSWMNPIAEAADCIPVALLGRQTQWADR